MRLLNAEVSYSGQKQKCAPEAETFHVRGKSFLLDANALALWELEKENESPPLATNKPKFPRPHTVPRTLVLESTQRCNLACKYCFASEYESAHNMTTATARKAIMSLVPRSTTRGQWGRRPTVGFFGGEPLMNFPLMQRIVPFAEGYYLPQERCGFSITTNATLLTDEIAAFLKEHGFSLIVSLDGPQELHDAVRVTQGGGGSFVKVMRGIDALTRQGLTNYTLRSTFLPGEEHLLDRVRFLNEEMLDQGKGSWVSVEPVCITDAHCIRHQEARGYTAEMIDALEGEYMAVADYAIGRYQAGKPFAFHNLVKPLERLLWTDHNCSECGAGMGYLSVDWQGNIYACHRMNWGKIGNLDTGGIDEELRQPWCDNRLYRCGECMACPLRWACGGGCREAAYGEHGRLDKPYSVGCALMRIFNHTAMWVMSQVDTKVLAEAIPNPRRKVASRACCGPRT